MSSFSCVCLRRLLNLAFAMVLFSSIAVAQPEGANRLGTLYLKNGDYVSGRMNSNDDDGVIRWNSPLFQDAVRFDLRGVSHISYAARQPKDSHPASDRSMSRNPLARGFLNLLKQLPTVPDPVPVSGDRVRVELTGGDVLFGTLRSIDDQHVRVSSERHGELTIRRAAVVELDGVSEKASLLFDGSGNLTDWTILSTKQFGVDDWQQQGGDLVTSKLGANLYHRSSGTGRYLLEVTLAGSGTPGFELVLGAGNSLNDVKNGFSVETWGRDVVIHRQAGNKMESSYLKELQLSRTDWSVELIIYCDPEARTCAVFSHGKLLGELHTKDQPELAGQGILIRNRASQLIVRRARMRRWIGPMQGDMPTTDDDFVVLTDGTWAHGVVKSLEEGAEQLTLSTHDGERTIRIDQIDRIRFRELADDARQAPSTAPMHIAYSNGGTVRGRFLRSDDEGIWLATDFSTPPVKAGWSSLLEVRLQAEDPMEEQSKKNGLVEHAGCSLHGRVINGIGPSDLRWEPVFSRDSVAFLTTRTTRVTFEPTSRLVRDDRLSSELSLVNGDSIPCQVDGIDEDAVIARFAAGETARVPRKFFKAIRDFRPENWLYRGFAPGDRWFASHKEGEAFRFRDGYVELFSDVKLARELPLPDRFRVSFDVRFWRNCSLLVGVGADSAKNALDRPQNRGMTEDLLKEAAKQKPDNLIEITLSRQGRAVTALGTSRIAGVLGMMFRANVFGVQNNRHAAVALGDTGSLHVELLVDRPARQYVVMGNGREMYRWRDATPLEGRFLHFGLGPVQNPRNAAQNNGAVGAVDTKRPSAVLCNFRVDRWPGAMTDDHRQRFLTRRMGASKKAVTHVLRAVNGDSLRGRLVGMRGDEIIFQSRLDTLTIPRQAVVEIISLQDGSDADAADKQSGDDVAARIRLTGGGTVSVHRLRTSDDFVLGESSLAGPVSVPWAAVSMIEFGGELNPNPPFGDWVSIDPPPLPTFDEASDAGTSSDWMDKPAPDFDLEILDGEKITLSDYRGRPVILDFWATWCGPCIASMPTLMELRDEFAGKVEFIAINQQEDPDEVREFLRSRLWKLRVGLDQDGSLNRLFGVNAIPYTMILDAEGIVRHVHIGATPNLKAELSEVLDGLLKP